MLTSKLDVCASPAWLRVLDDVARKSLGADDRTGPELAADVARISEAYTRERDSEHWTRVPRGRKALAARLRFFFVRDWMKAGLPIAELARDGRFDGRKTLRVLDLGAGLGATSLGAAHALKLCTDVESVELISTDDDRDAVDVMRALVEAAQADEETSRDLPRIAHAAKSADFFTLLAHGGDGFDLILAGFVWNELSKSADPSRLIQLVERALAPGGTFIVLEPALFDTTLALESLRDEFVATGKFHALAPCTHDAPCPMRANAEPGPDGKSAAHDWCHASLPLSLPPEVATTAREAGLRYERLSFSYVALGKGPRAAVDAQTVRVVSDALGSKGKTELLACGPAGLARHRLLDRERTPQNEAFADTERGDRWRMSSLEARVRPDVRIERLARAWPRAK